MDGIIPARAGFTRTPPCHPPTEKDHPRSRGVYGLYIRWPGGVQGSSPLARGLPTRCWAPLLPTRIIPARAGFTGIRQRRAPLYADHPRSRGVYLYVCSSGAFVLGSSPLARGLHVLFVGCLSGSSPLARGLPQAVRRERADRGIIPARAGFTGGACGACRLRWDHPRSRGVYAATSKSVMIDSGSSPLARGLLRRWRDHATG